MTRRWLAFLGILCTFVALLLVEPAPVHAVISLRVEPSVGWRNLGGDAGDDYEDASVIGLAVSAGLPTFPLRLRGGIDRSSHDPKTTGEFSGTVLSLDLLYQMGLGVAGIYVLGGVGRSNLEPSGQDDIIPPFPVYEEGSTVVRAGAGVRASLVPRLGLFAEGIYSIGEHGQNEDGSEGGRLKFLDLRAGAGITF